jgi:hypothetical protein
MKFIGLEPEARSIAVWHVEVVTGLLQTERYARAVIDPGLSLQVVLDESVLKWQFGNESVMYEQLQSLAAAATRPNISFYIEYRQQNRMTTLSSRSYYARLSPHETVKCSDGSPWTKSSLSHANGNCVEIANIEGGRVGMRDSKNITGPVLGFREKNGEHFLAVFKTENSTAFRHKILPPWS